VGLTATASAVTLAVACKPHKNVVHTSKAATAKTFTTTNTCAVETVLTSAATVAVAYT